jgi:hypothetical protein
MLVLQRQIDDWANVHPTLEERPPIGGRIDVAVRRQAVAVAVVIMQSVKAIAGPVTPRLRWLGSYRSKDKHRECNQSHPSHKQPPKNVFVGRESALGLRRNGPHFDRAAIRSKADINAWNNRPDSAAKFESRLEYGRNQALPTMV